MARTGPAVLLVRHSETEWSRSGQHTSRTDLPLLDEGRPMAAALGRRLAGRAFELVLSSPLKRAWETAELTGLGDVAEATDCSSLVEAAGGRVAVVEGDPRLVKVTEPSDLELVERLLGGE